jgi:hypothetical protein
MTSELLLRAKAVSVCTCDLSFELAKLSKIAVAQSDTVDSFCSARRFLLLVMRSVAGLPVRIVDAAGICKSLRRMSQRKAYEKMQLGFSLSLERA